MPGDPRLGSTPGFTVRGQNASPSQTHISINGNRMRSLHAHRRLGAAGAARRHLHARPAQRRRRRRALRDAGRSSSTSSPPGRRRRVARDPPSSSRAPSGSRPSIRGRRLIPGFDGLDQRADAAAGPDDRPEARARRAARQHLLPARHDRQDQRGRRRAGHLQRLRVPRRGRVGRGDRRRRPRRAGRPTS